MTKRKRPIYRICRTPAQITDASMWVASQGMQGLSGGPVKVELGRLSKARIQEEKYHAMMSDIEQINPERPPEVWKALLVKWFELELEDIGEPLRKPGKRIFDERYQEWMYVRPSTTGFTAKEAAKFIEWLYCFGTNAEIKWSEKALEIYNEYKEAQ